MDVFASSDGLKGPSSIRYVQLAKPSIIFPNMDVVRSSMSIKSPNMDFDRCLLPIKGPDINNEVF